jgi:peptidoglycan lytic transglycosylase G
VTARGLRRLAAVAVALAALAFLWALFQPFAGDGGDQVRVTVPKQAGVARIGDILDEAGVVPSGSLFTLRARLAGDSGDLKPGVYYLREHMSYGDVLDRLVSGPGGDLVQLTIPEGLSRREIAPLVRKAGLRGDYLEATADLGSADLPLKQRPKSLEGVLFPATYELHRGASVRSLVQKQLAAFTANFAKVDRSYSRSKNLTDLDVLTIASMVEREAQLGRERPLIAAIIYNRLRARQPLGIDATIRFATGNWSSPLTKSELAIDSPYNTRTRAGLPPGPIGNPGLASIEAAARPARVGYLYYVVKPGTCGEHIFSTTFAQFQRDQRRYQEARDRAGGRSPTSC